jgi:hypothetical protein
MRVGASLTSVGGSVVGLSGGSDAAGGLKETRGGTDIELHATSEF